MVSFNGNIRGEGSQTFGHTLRGLPFTDKCIGASGECGLLTGVQVADEDDDQRDRAYSSKFFKGRSG
jgi:hypothetical protein